MATRKMDAASLEGRAEAEAPPLRDGGGSGDEASGDVVLAPEPEEEAHHRWRALGARINTLQAVQRKKAAQAERSQLLASMQQLPCLTNITERAMQRLCELGMRRTYGRGELLLADPPHANLGSASSSERVVGLICGGEAQLVGAIASRSTAAGTAGTAAAAGGSAGSLPSQPAARRGASPPGRQVAKTQVTKVQVTKAAAEEGEPMSEEPLPSRRAVLAYVRGGGRLLPVATLGHGEVLHAGLITEPGARCCLQVASHACLELVLLPKKDFLDALRGTERAAELERAAARAAFFGGRLQHATSTAAALSHTAASQTPSAAASATAAAAAAAAAAAPPLPLPHGATPADAGTGAAADAEVSSSSMVSSACLDRAPPALTLEELDLTSNGIGGGEGAAAVALLLARAPALRRLDLGHNGLEGTGCVALADAVAALPALQSVGLAANDIDDDAVCGLALALRRRGSPVRELDLEANLASDAAMQELLRFCAASVSLITLRTGANAVGPAGGGAAAAHLLAHPDGPLASLGLSNNPLGKAAGAALAAAMRENQVTMHV